MSDTHKAFMQKAIDVALAEVHEGRGGPFGALVVCRGEIIGTGTNRVTPTNDPTAHAEIVAIREACRRLGSFQLAGCTIYTTCEPCPMCLGAIYWARPDAVFYACTQQDAGNAGFDDKLIREQMRLPADQRRIPMRALMRDAALVVFEAWRKKADKVDY